MPQSPVPVPQIISASAIGVGAPLTISGTTHTLGSGDLARYLRCTSGSATTITIPADATVNLPIGCGIPIEQAGAGQVTVAAAGGVTLNSAGGLVASAAQYSVIQLMKVAANTWTLVGDRA